MNEWSVMIVDLSWRILQIGSNSVVNSSLRNHGEVTLPFLSLLRAGSANWAPESCWDWAQQYTRAIVTSPAHWNWNSDGFRNDEASICCPSDWLRPLKQSCFLKIRIVRERFCLWCLLWVPNRNKGYLQRSKYELRCTKHKFSAMSFSFPANSMDDGICGFCLMINRFLDCQLAIFHSPAPWAFLFSDSLLYFSCV